MGKAVLVLISMVYPLSEFDFSDSGVSGSAKRVVAIAVDGARESEAAPVFQEFQKKMNELGLYSFWRGQNHKCTTSQESHMSLPGYSSVFSGYAQKNIINNRFQGKLLYKTLFEEYPDSQLFSAWNPIVNAVSNDIQTLGRAFISGSGNKPGEDIWVMSSFRLVHDFNNRFIFVHLGDADEYAHVNNWKGYVDAIRTEADAAHEIIQSSEIAGMKETVYFIFSDHGRGRVFWQEHGPMLPESREIWMLEINPYGRPTMTGECNHIGLHAAIEKTIKGR